MIIRAIVNAVALIFIIFAAGLIITILSDRHTKNIENDKKTVIDITVHAALFGMYKGRTCRR